MAAFQTEQKKVAELEGKLSSQMKTMEMENLKLRNANKVSLICFLYSIQICIYICYIWLGLYVYKPYDLYHVITDIHVHPTAGAQ